MDEDICRLRLGAYAMHFSGYQPEQSGTTEFCEDIPKTGQVIISMDMIDEVLRTLPVSVRIIRDAGDGAQIEQNTVLFIEPKIYPNGNVSFEYNFDQPGKFAGLVTAGAEGEYVSLFPFSVGQPAPSYGLYALIAAVIGAGFAFYKYSAARDRQSA